MICNNCNAPFKSNGNNSKFCSKECRISFNKKKYICKHCNKTYSLTNSHKSKIYCDICKDITYEVTCPCGCNSVHTVNIYSYDNERGYIKGHGRKNRKNTEKHNNAIKEAANKKRKPKIYKLCGCGCGGMTCNKHFIHGHNVLSDASKLKGVETKKKNGSYECSDERRANISKSKMGSLNGMYNKKHSKDTIEKISIASKHRWEDEQYRHKHKLSMETSDKVDALRLTKEDMLKKIEENNPDISISNFEELDDIVYCHSSKCNHKWKTKVRYIMYGSGCHVCSFSRSEKLINSFLEKNNIDFIPQKRFNDCKIKKTLPFDFYLPKYNLCIEYDGEQHFKPIDYFGGENTLKLQQIRDQVKNEYCKNNNIRLLRIPYYDKENIFELLSFVLSEIELSKITNKYYQGSVNFKDELKKENK